MFQRQPFQTCPCSKAHRIRLGPKVLPPSPFPTYTNAPGFQSITVLKDMFFLPALIPPMARTFRSRSCSLPNRFATKIHNHPRNTVRVFAATFNLGATIRLILAGTRVIPDEVSG